ncbi:hypothetical protein JW710_03775 [Candidatus Dojkabacteria bacterium]|nr:hypothetical protein [Candidatus Dojkabacteria bacterium]
MIALKHWYNSTNIEFKKLSNIVHLRPFFNQKHFQMGAVIYTLGRISSKGMLKRARGFYSSAEFLRLGKAGHLSVIQYLYCHSIELAFKVYLWEFGIKDEKKLKEFGHDLEQLYKYSKLEYSFPALNKRDFNLLNSVNIKYSNKYHEYFYTDFGKKVKTKDLSSLSSKILEIVSDSVSIKKSV